LCGISVLFADGNDTGSVLSRWPWQAIEQPHGLGQVLGGCPDEIGLVLPHARFVHDLVVKALVA